MTHYRRANDAQRHDPELRAAVKAELKEQYEILASAKAHLEKAYEKLQTASAIEEDDLDQSSGLYEAKLNTYSAIRRFDYKIKSVPTETYIGNVAALMSAEKAEELKEKHRGIIW
jgi:hypothetical protein